MSSSARLSLAELCNQPLLPPPSSSSSSPSSSSISSPASPMSSPDVVHAGSKRPLAIEDHDEDVRIAARALGDMRSRAVAHARAPSAEAFAVASQTHSRTSSASQSTPFLSPSTTPSTISNSSPLMQLQPLDRDNSHHHHQETSSDNSPSPSKDFVSRVVHSPIVSSVLNVYEDSKKRSKVVQIGANLMESSVKTISRPVINRLPVDQLDEFACRQLDRICPIRSPPPSSPNTETSKDNTKHSYTAYRDPVPLESVVSSRAPSVAPDDYSVSNSPTIPVRNLPDDPEKKNGARDKASQQPSQQQQQQQDIAAKSKWQTMLCEAGGISAAVSQESMKRLQYCLQWLQYATNRIDAQIVVLRSFIDSLTPKPPHENDPHALVPLQVMRTLTDVRRDLVNTIREVVKVISTYAGSALPEPARSTVRTFLLRLPARWASATGGGDASNPPSMPPSPRMQQQRRLPSSDNLAALNNSLSQIQTQNGHAHLHPRPTAGRATHPTALAATQAAQRILTLATESLDMMRGVTNVFKESLERADAWVERLRVVGIQRHDGASDNAHILSSSPGAGPSNSNNSTALAGNGEVVSSPSEADLHTIYYSSSSSSSIRSVPSLSLGPRASTSASVDSPRCTNDELTVMKNWRRRSNDSTDTTTTSASANESDHHSREDIQSDSQKDEGQEDDETETEDAASFRSCAGSTRKRDEEKTNDDIVAAANDIETTADQRNQNQTNMNVRRRRFNNSADTDDCSDGSFHSAAGTGSMDID